MKRSALLAGLMVLAAASSAAAQARPGAGLFGQARQGIERQVPSRPVTATTTNACPAGAYSVVQSPDGSSVSVLFHQFMAETEGGAATVRATCRIQIPLAVAAGQSLSLTSVDYRGFAMLGQRQSAEIAVDYEVGRGNRAPRFQRRLQGTHEGDFAFTDRLPPGRLRQAGCGARGAPVPILAIDASLTLTSAGGAGQALVSLDTADQAATGALQYRFVARPCLPRGADQEVLQN